MQPRPIVVAVGASAGGVEALRSLFREARKGANVAFIVLLHLDPDRHSALPEILRRDCAIKVVTAQDGMIIEADSVLVVPPGVLATVAQGRIALQPGDHSSRDPRSIDVLFSSLALDLQECAVGVVLSGYGRDGTLGIKAIKEQGGLTIAQGADSGGPGHSGMPDSAIAGGLVDLILPASEIAAALADYAASFGPLAKLTAGVAERSAEEQARIDSLRAAICTVLRQETGHDFSGYKEATFLRRVQRRMQVLRATSLEDYLERLRSDHGEALALLRDLLISVTAFFRDEEAYAALAAQVIPRLFEGKGAGDTVRVWVPGCATGEEAYSIAMLLSEHAAGRKAMPRLQVFATDIDDSALQLARAGRYPQALLEPLSAMRLDSHFTRDGAIRTVSKEIRDICVFSSHSLIRDPPFSRLDLVSCRNLLIYLDADAQRDVFPVFHFALRPHGYLFLGGAESANQFGELFIPVDKQHRIYQRRDHVSPKLHVPLPRSLLNARNWSGGGGGAHRQDAVLSVKQAAEAAVLARFGPAHVVVNRDGDVVHYSSGTGRFLEAAPGQPTTNVMAMARRGLRLDLRTALQDAVAARTTVTRTTADTRAAEHPVTITIAPLAVGNAADPLFLIVFNAAPSMAPQQLLPAASDPDEAASPLERELRETRDRLQSMIEEYETAVAELRAGNEEMVSINEELQSANEELETSKEEQQSVNEELQTVNQELQTKVEQLDRANADLRNLFDATKVATVTLDRGLNVRSFTPAVASVFNLRPSDIARPLADIVGTISTDEILRDARSVLHGGQAIERRVSRRDRTEHFLARTVPYRIGDGTVDGVLMAFVNVTPLVDAAREAEHQRILIAELNHRVGNLLTVVIALTRQTLQDGQPMSEVGEALIGRLQSLSQSYRLVLRKSWEEISLSDLVHRQLAPHLSDPERGRVSGPVVMLEPASALALGLILHELATNATKYGALSDAAGTVAVSWTVTAAPAGSRLVLRWEESGGPKAVAPTQRGFGSQLVSGQVEQALGGTLEQHYSEGGYSATISLPWKAAPAPAPA